MINNTRKFNRNRLPDNLERVLFCKADAIVETIISVAKTLCRNHISEEYIHKAFNNFKRGYYYKQDNNVVGFCIWQERRDIIINSINDFKYMPILLESTLSNEHKLGKIMLFDIETFALVHNFNSIRLQPLNTEIVPYYETLGYKMPTDAEYFFMKKTIKVFRLNKKVHNSKTRKQTRPVPFIIK
jgi:hypothetical protein